MPPFSTECIREKERGNAGRKRASSGANDRREMLWTTRWSIFCVAGRTCPCHHSPRFPPCAADNVVAPPEFFSWFSPPFTFGAGKRITRTREREKNERTWQLHQAIFFAPYYINFPPPPLWMYAKWTYVVAVGGRTLPHSVGWQRPWGCAGSFHTWACMGLYSSL